MTDISLSEATEILRKAGSPAANTSHYEGKDMSGGWAFMWSRSAGPVPLGARAWVVTDSGRMDITQVGETGAEAIQRLTG